ncbi:MAG: hypothetical protein NC405_08340 [Odoribacter sp.]|nr:hypothetical protein [Odoribacter sp.]
MIHSTYYHKDTHEDPKTSTVFESMLMLPDELFWKILRQACFDNDNLPFVAGKIESYDFWPHWNPTKTTNSNLVEPDLFIRFQLFDVIIEAKYSEDGGQYFQQWKNEIQAYYNEYDDDNKEVYFIAVGGNADKQTESVELAKNIAVNKCTWLSLLIQVAKYKEELGRMSFRTDECSSLLRILDLTELGFNIHGVYNIHWFNELERTSPYIFTESISTLKTFFR